MLQEELSTDETLASEMNRKKARANENVLVLGGVHASTEPVSHVPELLFIAHCGTIVGRGSGGLAPPRHVLYLAA